MPELLGTKLNLACALNSPWGWGLASNFDVNERSVQTSVEGKSSLDRRKLHGLGVWKRKWEDDSKLEVTRPQHLKPESSRNLSKGLEASLWFILLRTHGCLKLWDRGMAGGQEVSWR